MLIKVTRDDDAEMVFEAPIERFSTSRTKSVVAHFQGTNYILYEGGNVKWFAHAQDSMHDATWRALRPDEQTTPTGRVSTSTPNIQNIPIRTEEGASIRRAMLEWLDNMTSTKSDKSQ